MNSQLETSKLIFRKLKISDYQKFRKLFFSCFKKKISYNFFKWRYFNDKFSFCYGAFYGQNLIANVGIKMMFLNNKKSEKVYCRHSSMVLNKHRGKGIFSKLLENAKLLFQVDAKIIVMWPNENNFATFGLKKNKIVKKKYYLYKTSKFSVKKKKTFDYDIDQLNEFKHFIVNNNNFFLKDFDYFSIRYLSYNSSEYLVNKFELNDLTSFFILKKIKDKYGFNYVLLDHFGSINLQKKHLLQLINEKQIIFLSKKKIYEKNYSLISRININIGFIKKTDVKKKTRLINKKFMLGDTDSFMSIN